jgi:hypothetical protein
MIDKVKELLLIEYPNSEFASDIIDCRYTNDILYMRKSDGQKIVYVLDAGEVIVFTEKKNDNFPKESILKAKKIMIELKLLQLIKNE